MDAARRVRLARRATPATRRCSPTPRSGCRASSSAGGLVLVDTPGVGGLGSAHGAATMSALPSADAVLLVSDAAQEYTGAGAGVPRRGDEAVPERRRASSPRPTCTRTGGGSSSSTAATSTPPGSAPTSFPVSSTLRLHAAKTQDADADGRVGLPASWSTSCCAGSWRASDDLDRRSTSQDVLAVAEQLATGMKAELAVQENPEQLEPLVAELTRAKARADELKQRSARWQITLNDGVGRPAVRHRLRPARPAAHDRAARPSSCSTTPTRPTSGTSSPSGSTSRWPRRRRPTSCGRPSGPAGWPSRWPSTSRRAAEIALPDLRFDQSRSLAAEGRPAGAAGRREASASARSSSRACAAATAACS